MEVLEHEQCDSEVIRMVNQNHFCYPTREQNRLMKDAQNMALLLKENQKQTRKPEDKQTEVDRQQLILQLCHGLVPICIGLAWVLGAIEGLADPAFTSIVAGACGLWGVVEWKWGKYRA